MKKALLSIPGKTFLAGEYFALLGGPAFVLCTHPRFELIVTESAKKEESPFHPESPAGRLYTQNDKVLSRYHLQWKDPYQGRGGFGASSAQFALLGGVLQLKEELFGESERFFDWHEMLTNYRQLAVTENKRMPPSGADLVGAIGGGVTFFDRNLGHAQTFSWPFQDLDFYIFHTGEKLATHEHLQNLKIFETQGFQAAGLEILKGFTVIDSQQMLAGVRAYRDELWKQGWITEKSKRAVQEFEKRPSVRVAKGCGAMGSDVVLVIAEKGEDASIRSLGSAMGLQFIAETKDLSKGLEALSLVEKENHL